MCLEPLLQSKNTESLKYCRGGVFIRETAQMLSQLGILRSVPFTKSSSSSLENKIQEFFLDLRSKHAEFPRTFLCLYDSHPTTAWKLEGLQGSYRKPACSPPKSPNTSKPATTGRLFQTSKFKHKLQGNRKHKRSGPQRYRSLTPPNTLGTKRLRAC